MTPRAAEIKRLLPSDTIPSLVIAVITRIARFIAGLFAATFVVTSIALFVALLTPLFDAPVLTQHASFRAPFVALPSSRLTASAPPVTVLITLCNTLRLYMTRVGIVFLGTTEITALFLQCFDTVGWVAGRAFGL